VLLGSSIAIVGVYWAFQSESDRIFQDQLDVFKRGFLAIPEEAEGNQALIKSIRINITTAAVDFRHISTGISESIVTNPLLYKYAGQEYVYSLSIYIDKAKSANRLLDDTREQLSEHKSISESNVTRVQLHLDDLLYYLYILQYQSQYYIYLYGDEGQLRPGNQQQIMKWLLKEENISSDGIKQKLDELVNISKADRQKLLKSTSDLWKKVRER
jgi:hypothetical protein